LAEATSYETQQQAAEQIHQLFERSTPSTELQAAIVAAHAELCRRSAAEPQPCAVRSSATAEDLADASFAGQQETYLWILGAEQVVEHVVRCWASLFTPQAIAYRAHRQQPVTDLAMGVVVQCMVPAEAAGVMLTLDPITGDRSHITIEAAYGLGAAVVNGEVTPDRYGVDKVLLEIRSRSISPKTVAYRFDPSVQGTRLEPVPAPLQTQPCLGDEEVLELARLGKRMEQAAGRPQDLEWAIGPDRAIFLLQARPETIWSQKQPEPLVAPGSTAMDRLLEMLRGPAATRKEPS
jgi:pyruvate,water dikinase